MKKILVVIVILAFSLSAFAKDDAKKAAEKPDLKTMRKIQYYKIVATEEINIIEKFIKCLDGAKNKDMMNMCSRARNMQMGKLRKTATPKTRPANINPHKSE